MTYEEIQQLNPPQFKRFCGVSRETFQMMVSVLTPHLNRTGKRGGQSKLSVEAHLLIPLKYWREYRTQFHIAQSRGIHQATVCRIVRKVEEYLIRSRAFSLPGKRQILQPEQQWNVVVVDVSETPIKKRRKHKRSKDERQHNRLLARLRVVVEHANRRLKIFRILSER